MKNKIKKNDEITTTVIIKNIDLITINDLISLKDVINLKSVCKQAGIPYQKIYKKMILGTELSLDDSISFTEFFKSRKIYIDKN